MIWLVKPSTKRTKSDFGVQHLTILIYTCIVTSYQLWDMINVWGALLAIKARNGYVQHPVFIYPRNESQCVQMVN